MQSILAPLLPLVLSLGCIHAHHSSDNRNLHPTPDHPLYPLPSGITSTYPDLVAYAEAQKALGDSVSRVPPEFELELLSDAAEEVKHLKIYDDNQRERLSAIREATRAIIKQRSALPTTIDPDTDLNTLTDLAVQFEVTFLEYASLASSSKWAKYCMAALLGKDTLIRLLPRLSKGFFNQHKYLMLQAAAVVEDFDTFCAVANHSGISLERLRWLISENDLFSGGVEFVQRIIDLIPSFITTGTLLLSKAIRLNHRSLFEYLHAEITRQRPEQRRLEYEIKGALVAMAGRGWEDEFKQLHSEHPQLLDTETYLIAAAKHGRVNILKYLLVDDGKLAEKARPHINIAFEVAVGSGSIDAINFFLGYEGQNTITPNLFVTRPTPVMLKAVGGSGRWDGIEYLMRLKNEGDIRFEKFKLTGNASEALGTACCHGNLQVLRQLLQRNPHGQFVFALDPTSLLQASLLNACKRGHLPIVQELLKCSNVNPAENENEALIAACACGHHLVVRELLRDKRVDAGAGEGESLIAACESGHHLVVRELLQQCNGQYIYNFDLAAEDNALLIEACESGRLLVVRELLRHESVDLGARDGKPLMAACRAGRLLVVRELLQKHEGRYIYTVEPDVQDNEALIAACKFGHLPVVQELLQHKGVDPDARNNTPLITACENGNLLVVRELLQHKNVNPSARDGKPLISACRKGHLLVVRELLQKLDGQYIYNVNPDVRDNEALIAACEAGQLLVVQELLRHERVDAGARNNAPLIAACAHGHLPVVQELLQKDKDGKYIYNVDPAARNNTPLIGACQHGHVDIVEFLLQRRPNARGLMEYEHAGIDAAAQDNMALLRALEQRHIKIVKFLLRKMTSGECRFPGIEITEQMRQIAARTRDKELQESLEWQYERNPCVTQ